MRRQAILPFGFAVALSVAAGLALAEEHAWPHAAPTGWSGGIGDQTKPGTVSRALAGGHGD